ncbi:hypothetical protein KCP69_26135 [Salmonella enterica subsp. enterica]|nr:hypothetical protein KCP69_26135 [Salmonella enterica subsp. enterica]
MLYDPYPSSAVLFKSRAARPLMAMTLLVMVVGSFVARGVAPAVAGAVLSYFR